MDNLLTYDPHLARKLALKRNRAEAAKYELRIWPTDDIGYSLHFNTLSESRAGWLVTKQQSTPGDYWELRQGDYFVKSGEF